MESRDSHSLMTFFSDRFIFWSERILSSMSVIFCSTRCRTCSHLVLASNHNPRSSLDLGNRESKFFGSSDELQSCDHRLVVLSIAGRSALLSLLNTPSGLPRNDLRRRPSYPGISRFARLASHR